MLQILTPRFNFDHLAHTRSESSTGAFNFSQAVITWMLEHNTGGSLLFTGATASLKGSLSSLLAA